MGDRRLDHRLRPGDAAAGESDWRRNDDSWVDNGDFVVCTGHANQDGWVLSSPDDGFLSFTEVGSGPQSPGGARHAGGMDARRIVLVAQDCPVRTAVPPPAGRRGRSVAQVQYDLLSAEPFRWTENEVLFESWWRRQDAARSASEAEKECVRAEWLRGSRPCLRASPLPQRYGWGLLFDADDRVALCAVESDDYRALASGEAGVEVQRSFRRSRR